MTEEAQALGRGDEPQHSGAVVAVYYGDYQRQEIFIRSSASVGNWYCLGGEYGRPKPWDDPRTELGRRIDRGPAPKPGPNEIPRHPRWEDVLTRGPVTLLVAGDKEAYASGWANGRRRLVEQIETLSEEGEPE